MLDDVVTQAVVDRRHWSLSLVLFSHRLVELQESGAHVKAKVFANANVCSALENVLNVRICNHLDDSAYSGGLECFQHPLFFPLSGFKGWKIKRR